MASFTLGTLTLPLPLTPDPHPPPDQVASFTLGSAVEDMQIGCAFLADSILSYSLNGARVRVRVRVGVRVRDTLLLAQRYP